MTDFLAVDLGAGSGRVMAGRIMDKTLSMKCIHRFPTRKVYQDNLLLWDTDFIFSEILQGIKLSVKEGYKPLSISIDTWGVDFVLISPEGEILSPPMCYRDSSLSGLARDYAVVSPDAYSISGIQPMNINTDGRLWKIFKNNPDLKDKNPKLLMMADYFAWSLSGVIKNEFTLASTSGLIDAEKATWSKSLIERINVPESVFAPIVSPGTFLGTIRPDLSRKHDLPSYLKIYTAAAHDTQSAILSLPPEAFAPGSIFLISGTWSLLGAVIPAPILSQEAKDAGLSNEGLTPRKQISILQNITGMWILQRLMEEWEAQGESLNISSLIEEARSSSFSETFDVDSPLLHNPQNMQQAIKSLLPKDKSPVSTADFTKSVLLSLAVRYNDGIKELNKFLPSPASSLYIPGGGSRNLLLNEMIHEVSGINVIPAEPEASAAGNIITQALAQNIISSAENLKIYTVSE